jgi:O-antigen/teichoic acid export membrane protein
MEASGARNSGVIASSPASLKVRVLSAGMWTLAGFALSTIIRFGTNLVMTRLLAPEMFGILSIASTVIVGLGMFSDLGLKQSIVRSQHSHEPTFLNTGWSIQIIRGLLLWIAALLASMIISMGARIGQIPAGSVYADPSLQYVLAVLSFAAVIGGFDSTKLIEASRDLSIRTIIKIEVLSQVLGVMTMLAWVSIHRSIWVLVAGSIGSTTARMILGHLTLSGTRNRWQLHRNAASELIHFGKWILMASILGFLVNSGDRLLLAGLIDPRLLGLYSIAGLFVGLIDGILSRVIGDVTFPAFSEIVRQRPADLKRSYYSFHSLIAAAAYFASGALMASGQAIIALLYDQRYQESGWMLQFLAAVLLTVPFRLGTQTFMALGQPKLQSNIVVVRLILLFVLLPLLFHFFGFAGAMCAIVISQFSSVPITILYNVQNGLFDPYKELLYLVWIPVGFGTGKLMTFVTASISANRFF